MQRRRRASRYSAGLNTTSTQIGLGVNLAGRSGPGSYRHAFRRIWSRVRDWHQSRQSS